MSTLLKNATIIAATSPYHLQKKDILISNSGTIDKIAENISNEGVDKVITLENLHISAGWFDTSVSLGEPGFEERETIKNGLQVAAKSGFTSIAVNANTNPIIDSKSDVEFLINKANNSATNLYPIAALTQKSKGIEMAELYDMQQSGAIAFGDYNKAIENDNLMKVALLYAQNFNGLVLSFPKNNAIAGEGIANEGIQSTKLGLKGIPALAEHIHIARDLFLLEYTGGKLHIPTISSAKSVDLIKEAKRKGMRVTCSVSAHHLTLTDEELNEFDSNFKTAPPLRTKQDIKALQEGVKTGVIDIITSDHNPIDIEHKKVEFSEAKDGVIGLESAFAAINSVLEISEYIDCITTNPKTIFGIPNLELNEGEKADITLFNPQGETTFLEESILSTSKNSPFLNKILKGKAYGIFANNQLILN
ncbi:MAG: dihydroorotase [Polaribacter sp.]|nr:dihydroorotase [Polaribacter sp.]